jgi:hypothetical protein
MILSLFAVLWAGDVRDLRRIAVPPDFVLGESSRLCRFIALSRVMDVAHARSFAIWGLFDWCVPGTPSSTVGWHFDFTDAKMTSACESPCRRSLFY